MSTGNLKGQNPELGLQKNEYVLYLSCLHRGF